MARNTSTAARDGRAGVFCRESIGRLAGRTVLPGLAAAAAAGLLAACGSTGTSGTGGGTAHQPRTSHHVVVSARRLPGVGTVLVNRSGRTLYSPQQEAHGKILCTGSCLSFWFPVPASAGAVPPAPSGVSGAFGTIRRPDGRTQLTYNGKPLYTFRLDTAAGQAHGNNFTDNFSGTSFTWQVVVSHGTAGGAASPTSSPGYSYGNGY